jgi:putative tryptophan/tyrosine transport system substrate-binding protein
MNGRSRAREIEYLVAQLATFAIRHGVPTIFGFREFVQAGGPMAYGGSLTESFRWVGVYTGRIVKGEGLANLPVQRSTKIELFINLKTAEALGIEVPPALLTRADDVIE